MTEDERNAIERFPNIAEEFCHLIDDCDKSNRRRPMQELAVHLARLCEVALWLLQMVPATEGVDHTSEAVAAHTDERVSLSNNLRRLFGPLNGYWEVFDPSEKEGPVFGSLGIEVAKVYLDLKEALKLLNSVAALNDVHWERRFGFHSHWSKHAASALRALIHISALA